MARLVQLQPVNLAVMADGAYVAAAQQIHWGKQTNFPWLKTQGLGGARRGKGTFEWEIPADFIFF